MSASIRTISSMIPSIGVSIAMAYTPGMSNADPATRFLQR